MMIIMRNAKTVKGSQSEQLVRDKVVMFVAKSSGKLCFVSDFRQLNKFLERPHHQFLITETLAKMVRG